MKRLLAYITAPWSNSQYENAENAAAYCRQVYDAGYSPICPVLFLSDTGYEKALDSQEKGQIKILSHAKVRQGNLHYDRTDQLR